ncbi:MAG TPA: VOC family protein [Jiangellales bacterium]|nr:VOC family protein [Jiangellales bacterium]
MPVNLDPTFRTRRVREGYDLDEVDDFVDRVLDVLEGKTGPSSALSPEAIEAYEFRVVRFRECYSMDDVDDWLDAAAAELRRAAPRREPRAAAQAADPEATQAWPAPVPAAAPVPVAAAVAAAAAPTPAHARVSSPPGPPPGYTQIPPQAQDQTLGDVLAPFAYERANGSSTIPAPRHQARPVPSVPAPSVGLHHVDIWVEDLSVAVRSFGWLFERLGWTLFQVWEHGRSWQSPGQGPYVVLEASPALRRQPYDRLRQGLNHLAIAVPEHWMVDRIVAEAPDYGWRLLFSDRHPYAGGPSHYAAYLENAEGFEVEVVAS